jgi:FAD/FMN-containing dehydrogenase
MAATPDQTVVARFQRRMHGELLIANTAAYEAVWLVQHQPRHLRPALIARCLSTRDVACAVGLARELGLEVNVRSGDHKVASHRVTANSLLIDLCQMRQILIDPLQRIARMQGGTTNNQLMQAAATYNLTVGTCATDEVGDARLGVNIGWLLNRCGATMHNVLVCEVVTADGAIVTTSAYEHPDLFEALCNGGNHGIVTALTCRLYPLGS